MFRSCFPIQLLKNSCHFSKHVASFIRETLKNLLFIVSNILGLGSTQSRTDGINNLLRPTWANFYPSSSSLFYKSSLLILTKAGVLGKNSDVIHSIALLSELKVIASVGTVMGSDWVLGMSSVKIFSDEINKIFPHKRTRVTVSLLACIKRWASEATRLSLEIAQNG